MLKWYYLNKANNYSKLCFFYPVFLFIRYPVFGLKGRIRVSYRIFVASLVLKKWYCDVAGSSWTSPSSISRLFPHEYLIVNATFPSTWAYYEGDIFCIREPPNLWCLLVKLHGIRDLRYCYLAYWNYNIYLGTSSTNHWKRFNLNSFESIETNRTMFPCLALTCLVMVMHRALIQQDLPIWLTN